MARLLFALYRARNSSYQMGLTPSFEIMFGTPPPIAPNLWADLLAELDDQDLLNAIRGIEWAHKEVWPKLRALYESGVPPKPHRFQPRDEVYIKRHCLGSLEPR